MKFDWAPSAFRALNGVFCVYKPTDMSIRKLIQTLKNNIIRDLNKLPCYKYELHRQLNRNILTEKLPSGETIRTESTDVLNISTDVLNISTNMPAPISADVPMNMVDMSEHRLVLGSRYIEDDINLGCVSALNKLSSGVLVIGIGQRRHLLPTIARARLVRVYHVKGRLGVCTQNFTPEGHIIERTSYFHVKKTHIDKICSSVQTSHLKKVFEYAGVQADSQEAYELATIGLIRPTTGRTPPIIYDIRCIHFLPPYFTLEIQIINETSAFLMGLVHDVGVAVKSGAVCEHIHRLRHGHFTTDHSLLRSRWTLCDIIMNIRECSDMVTPDQLYPGPVMVDTVAVDTGAGVEGCLDDRR